MNNITVIGGANIDIFGYVSNDLIMKDSNPGRVQMSFGGVGRNIGTNCALLGQNVSFVTVFSDNPFGKMLREDFIAHHINIEDSKVVTQSASIYLALMNEENDMQVAVSDMHILENLDTTTVDNAMNKMDASDLLIVDTNLEHDMLEYIFHHKKCLLALDPISTAKALKIKEELSYIDIFKPNQIEAEALSEIKITDENSAKTCLDYFLDLGIKEIVISLGKNGVLLGYDNERYWFKHDIIKGVNSTGAGDSFLSGYVSYRSKGLKKAIHYAIATSMMTIQSDYSVNEDLCEEELNRILEKLIVKEINLCTLK